MFIVFTALSAIVSLAGFVVQPFNKSVKTNRIVKCFIFFPFGCILINIVHMDSYATPPNGLAHFLEKVYHLLPTSSFLVREMLNQTSLLPIRMARNCFLWRSSYSGPRIYFLGRSRFAFLFVILEYNVPCFLCRQELLGRLIYRFLVPFLPPYHRFLCTPPVGRKETVATNRSTSLYIG